jgi:molybdopterin molybdotransferase
MKLDLRITKLRIKPGKPFVFASGNPGFRTQNSGLPHVFGLPGNPVSGFVCTVRLASRLIERLAGGLPRERWVAAKLAAALPANGPREFYQPTQLDWTTQGPLAIPLSWKGSADLFTLASAHGLLMREENESARSAGDVVRVLEI